MAARARVAAVATAVTAVAVAGALAALAPPARPTRGLATPARTTHVVYDSPQSVGRSAQVPSAPPGWAGGPTTAATGETVAVYVSPTIAAADPTAVQRWADFLAALPHGPELSQVTVLIAAAFEVRRLCGAAALGCYDDASDTLVSIGQDAPDASAASVLTHEYAHHIENNRLNPPWDPVEYGTKRWASYVDVCKRAASGELAPGDEGTSYQENPGELFAETYRVLAERLHGLPESPWSIVDQSLYPDDAALQLVQQDVLDPWTANTTTSYAGLYVKGSGIGRRYLVQTPYDGTFTVSLTEPARTEFDLRLVDPSTGAVLALSRTGLGTSRAVTFSVCGQRMLRVGITRIVGFGPYALQISKP